jgi:glutamate synthase (NADPH/NADH) small chain
MGKATGFLEYQREENPWRSPEERIKSFEEFRIDQSDEERERQSARCMNCGVPLCQSAIRLSGMVTGCPLHNLIPEWNDEVYKGHFRQALARLLKTNNFPEFTGRVCPALCEKACTCGLNDEPVTIHDNELFIIEHGFANGDVQPRIPKVRSGKKVAVIGSGPSGLAAADQLNHRGHSVTVYERDDQIGGLLMYGIPNMKLDKKVVLRRRKLMEKEGVRFVTGCDVGKDVTAEELKQQFDAVVLCCGAKKARSLSVEGFETVKGVHYAVDFLKSATRHVVTGETSGWIDAKGKHVVVVGGGDTGNDCVGTCIRQGCKSVVQLEMMPQPPKKRLSTNPWPEWPKVLKTDYGQQEAIAVFGEDPRVYQTTIKELHTTKTGRLRSVTTVQVRFENGSLTEVEGTEKTVRCELLLIAAGFIGCEDYVAEAFQIARGPRGTLETEEQTYKTSRDGVFAAGDAHRGQSLVVWAITEGRECARQVDAYLMGYTNM